MVALFCSLNITICAERNVKCYIGFNELGKQQECLLYMHKVEMVLAQCIYKQRKDKNYYFI